MKKESDRGNPISIFYSYAPQDENLRNDLDKHLSLLQRNGTITTWHNRQIIPGTDWAHIIDRHLNEASLILLLISPDFLASDYCYAVEMQRALERHKNNEARVIPIILRPVDWDDAPFAHLQCLPPDKKPITAWKNRDAAFLHIAKGIRDAIEDLDTSAHSTTSSDRYRQRLMKTVRSIWVTGILEQSLHHTDLLILNMHEQPDAIDNPWQETVQETKLSPNPLTPGTQIIQIYDDADGDLLILGEPGSGKTIQLLELTRNLLDHAEQDAKHPIPVVFHIASYCDQYEKEEKKKTNHKEKLFADWLIYELNRKYKIPRKVGETWVKNDQILPLLDGLDEVEEKYQVKCIEMINTWKQEHILLPLVICSRFTEYMAKENRLCLQKAITLQPLTIRQLDEYLINADKQLEALRLVLDHDSTLRELATIPLMLSVMTLTYHGRDATDILVEDSLKTEQLEPFTNSFSASQKGPLLDAQRREVFATYVQHMLHRRGSSRQYSPQQTIYWLARLARSMDTVDEIDESAFRYPKWLLHQVWPNRIHKAAKIVSTILLLVAILCFGVLAFRWPSFFLIFPGLDAIAIGAMIVFGVKLISSQGIMEKAQSARTGITWSIVCIVCISISSPFFLIFFLQRGFLLLSDFVLSESPILLALLVSFPFLLSRMLFCLHGYVPWNSKSFLKYAAERILLRKVGNHYIFLHRLLRDYFASLDVIRPTKTKGTS